MSIRFGEVVFHNKNNIDVGVRIEAPIGTGVVSGTPVAKNGTARIPVGRDNCASVAIVANDGSHDEYRQTFAVNTPGSGLGRPAYLESVEVDYVIGSFSGGFTARTD
jgi:hypothetical protein